MINDKGHTAPADQVLLVFNCHEAWVYQLAVLGYRLDIAVGLKGRYKSTWDRQMRPVPANARLVSLSDALACPHAYHCIVAHNITDLLDVRNRPEPRLLVIHSTIEGRMLEENSDIVPAEMRRAVHDYVRLVGAHVVAVSRLKGQSWGFTEDIVPFCCDPADYLPYSGHEAAGLRVCNFLSYKKKLLLWDFHVQAFGSLPVRIVGHNPDLPGVAAARDWAHLKRLFQAHRFYIHTADPQLEDGYNMATVEAMAAGMPVLGNNHPGSPVRHGVSGFLSDDPAELRRYAQILLNDRDLAIKMGQEARRTVLERFSTESFRSSFLRSIQTARDKASSRSATT